MTSKDEIQSHIELVSALILRGYRRSKVVELVSQQTGKSARTVERYYSRALEDLSNVGSNQAERRALLYSRAELIYRELIAKDEYSSALRAIQVQQKILEEIDKYDTQPTAIDEHLSETLANFFAESSTGADPDDGRPTS